MEMLLDTLQHSGRCTDALAHGWCVLIGQCTLHLQEHVHAQVGREAPKEKPPGSPKCPPPRVSKPFLQLRNQDSERAEARERSKRGSGRMQGEWVREIHRGGVGGAQGGGARDRAEAGSIRAAKRIPLGHNPSVKPAAASLSDRNTRLGTGAPKTAL